MTIHERLKADLKHVIELKSSKNSEKKDALRVIIGEFSRLSKKNIIDKDSIKILKKLRKDEKFVIGKNEPTVFLEIVESYIPKQKQLSKEEILKYISTFDLTKFNNKLQAIGPIIKALKGEASGQDIKEVLFTIRD